jgi:hypothetical protein
MATTTGVSQPDKQEPQSPKKSAQSLKPDHAELAKLTEQELKSAIIAAWKKHPAEQRTGHGMSMCRKDAGGRWRILNMHNSVKEGNATDPLH